MRVGCCRDHRQLDRRGDGTEVLIQPLLRRVVVYGTVPRMPSTPSCCASRDNSTLSAVLLVVVPGDHRRAARVSDLDDGLEQRELLVVAERRRLARGAAHHHLRCPKPVAPSPDAWPARGRARPSWIEGGGHRRQQTRPKRVMRALLAERGSSASHRCARSARRPGSRSGPRPCGGCPDHPQRNAARVGRSLADPADVAPDPGPPRTSASVRSNCGIVDDDRHRAPAQQLAHLVGLHRVARARRGRLRSGRPGPGRGRGALIASSGARKILRVSLIIFSSSLYSAVALVAADLRVAGSGGSGGGTPQRRCRRHVR